MKRIFLVVMLLILNLGIASAEEQNHLYLDDAIPGIYTMMDVGYKVAANYVMPVRKFETGEYVYCVTPGVAIDPNGNYTKITEEMWDTLNISEEKFKKMQIISHYGYNYQNHTDLTWYAITQYLIWQEVLPEGWSVYFTEELRGDRTTKFDWMINELNNLVNSYYKNPSIDEVIEGNYKYNTELIDNNGVLGNYVPNNLNVSINNNKLIIKPSDNNFTFNLEINTNNKSSYLYTYNSAQWVMSIGSLPSKTLRYEVKIPKGNLIINKKIGNSSIPDLDITSISLKDAVYAVFNDDFYKEYRTDENGLIKIDNLNIGYYNIKEITPPKYFMKDDESQVIFISDDKTTNFDVFDDIIVSKLNIYKKYLDRETYDEIPENNACFGIYDSNNNLLISKTTNKDGYIFFNLIPGKYKLKQIYGIDNYYLLDSDLINVIDSKDINKSYLNRPIISKKENSDEIKLTNTLVKELNNPKTYDNINTYLLICVISIIIFDSFLIKFRKKRGNLM